MYVKEGPKGVPTWGTQMVSQMGFQREFPMGIDQISVPWICLTTKFEQIPNLVFNNFTLLTHSRAFIVYFTAKGDL